MKDFTNMIITNGDVEPLTMEIPIKFILYKTGSNKLALVKAIKNATGLGLKDAKDIVDTCSGYFTPSNVGVVTSSPIMFRRNMSKEMLDRFRNDLAATDSEFSLDDDRERIRNKKFIDLGIYNKDDLVDELASLDVHKIFINGFNSDNILEIFKSIYSNISEEKLIEIYKNYNEVTLH